MSTKVSSVGKRENVELAAGQILLSYYKECGQHMRFYADARFKILTLALSLATLLVALQQFLPDVGYIFALIGLISTAGLYSLEYRYHQAWLTLLKWAEKNVEDTEFGEGKGPLNSYKDLEHPWYVLKSRPATDAIYALLTVLWIGELAYYLLRALNVL